MVKKCLFVVPAFLCYISWVYAGDPGKYAAETNEESDKFEKPFRMMKLNLVWSKAQKRLSAGDLANFYKDLTVQDKLESELKKRKADGFDEDGEHEAKTRKHFMAVLARYNLHELHPEGVRRDGSNPSDNDSADDIKWENIKLDKKMGKLWQKAEMSGFTDEQLEALKREFLHHQEKLEEFEVVKDDLNRNFHDLSDNSLHGLKEDKLKLKKEERLALKNKYGELSESYKSLEESILGLTEKHEDINLQRFKHPKVMDLWLQARFANFTEEELRSFSQELLHFEHKLEKLDHFTNEAGEGTVNMKKMGANLENYPDKRLKLEEKVNEYGRKVKKIETELKDRIIRRHAEL